MVRWCMHGGCAVLCVCGAQHLFWQAEHRAAVLQALDVSLWGSKLAGELGHPKESEIHNITQQLLGRYLWNMPLNKCYKHAL